MTGRRWTAGALLALLALAGCAEGEASPENSPPSATTSSSSQTSTPAPATSNAPTPEEEAAEAATAVVNEMLRVTDAAKKDPGPKGCWPPTSG
jgi:glucose/arabinose dehydrogenase